MKKIFTILLTALLIANVPCNIASSDMLKSVSSNSAEQQSIDLPVMQEISKDDFNAQMQRMINEINDANGITEEELSAETAATYPSVYDPRTTGKVSAVSNQGNWGLCWVYSAIAMTEQNLIKRGYEPSSVDLSELHAAYFNYKSRNLTCPFTSFCSIGGDEGYILSDMAKGIGPVYESTVPMQTITDDLTLSDSLMYQHLYEPHKAESATIGTDTESLNAVKRLITDYGAVMASMYLYAHSNYLGFSYSTGQDMTYYLDQSIRMINHAITIVGWDDTYSAAKFQKTAPGNGAWLVKQSYGTNVENKGMGSGYMWISYYDESINGVQATGEEFTKNGNTPKTITLSASSLFLTKGKSAQLSATVAPASAVDKRITWESDNEAVATVTQTGLVKAVGKGKCNITVRSVDGYAETTCPVTVSVLVESISAEDMTLVKGQKAILTVFVLPDEANDKSYKVTSSDSSVASVSGKEVTAVKEGTATLTIETLDGSGIKKEVKVTVLSDAVLDICPDGFGNVVTIDQPDDMTKKIIFNFKVKANTSDVLKNITATISNENTFYLRGQGGEYEKDSDGNYGYQVVLCFETIVQEGETEIVVSSSDALKKECRVKIIYKSKNTDESGGNTDSSGTGEADPPADPTPQPTTCANGHDYKTVIKKATHTTDGYTQRQCTRCAHVTDKSIIPRASEIYLSAYNLSYNGKYQRPSVSVFDSKDNNITGKCRVTYSNNKKVGRARVKVSCNTDQYSFTAYEYFTITPKKTSIRKAAKDGNSLTVTWKKQSSQADGYEIQYSTKKSFKASATKTVRVKGSKKTEKTIKNLDPGKKYYVRIRTYKKVSSRKYYSEWSKAKKSN